MKYTYYLKLHINDFNIFDIDEDTLTDEEYDAYFDKSMYHSFFECMKTFDERQTEKIDFIENIEYSTVDFSKSTTLEKSKINALFSYANMKYCLNRDLITNMSFSDKGDTLYIINTVYIDLAELNLTLDDIY